MKAMLDTEAIKTNYYKVYFAIIFSILFLTYMIIPYFWGNDGYGFYINYCLGKPGLVQGISKIPNLLFKLIPCSPLAYKTVMLGIFLSWLYITKKTLELFKPKNVWKHLCLLMAFLPLLQFFFQLEDDNFAYPVLALSSYFMIKGLMNKSRTQKIISVLLVVFSGLFIWRGSELFLFIYSFITPVALGFFLISIAYIGSRFNTISDTTLKLYGSLQVLFQSLFPGIDFFNGIVQENKLGISTIFIILLFVFYSTIPKPLLIISAFFIIMSIFSIKWSLYAVVFLLIGSIYDKIWVNRFTVLIAGLVFLGYNAYLLSGYFPPSTFTWTQIENAKQVSFDNNLPLKTDWSHGYWAIYNGVNTPYFGGFSQSYDYNHSVVLTYQFDLNCPKFSENSGTIIYICH